MNDDVYRFILHVYKMHFLTDFTTWQIEKVCPDCEIESN